MVNITKIPPSTWLEEAQKALIRDGVSGVKIDRLAKSLGVTRGGFYHHFKNQQDLVDQLVRHWAQTNNMLPPLDNVTSPSKALQKIQELCERVIMEEDFSPALDLAIREWARIDNDIKTAVDKVDKERTGGLRYIFEQLGCDEEEAPIRARVFYFHQVGYYALGQHEGQTKAQRLTDLPIYLRILCGRRYIEAAQAENEKWQ